MKYYAVILLGILLVTPMLGCSKDDTTSPKVGVIYKSGDINDKNHTAGGGGRRAPHTPHPKKKKIKKKMKQTHKK
ncbi:MAG: hypothetical protein ACK41Q_07705, partial [Candidatus Brocadia sp.]